MDIPGRLPRKVYEKELRRLQIELVAAQEWSGPRTSAS
jgi:hypothetical protein